MAALTKADIVDTVQTKIDFTRHQSIDSVESLLERIKSELKSGEDVLVSGFGKFCVQEKRERRGRKRPPVRIWCWHQGGVTFNCSGKLRERINET